MDWQQNRWTCQKRFLLTAVTRKGRFEPTHPACRTIRTYCSCRQEEQQLGQEHAVATYLDDRTLAVATRNTLPGSGAAGKSSLELWENSARVQVVPRKAAYKPALLAEGVFMEERASGCFN